MLTRSRRWFVPARTSRRARSAISRRSCSRCAADTSKRHGGCSPPAPDVNDASPDGTRVLTMAIVNAHYELAGAAARARAPIRTRTDPRGSALHALSLDAKSGLRRGAAAHVHRHARQPGAGARAPRRAARSRTLRVSWKEVPFDRDLGMVRSPAGISIGRNWMSFVGATPFFIAAKGADLALMRLLIEHGADPKTPDRAERHAAHGGRRARLLGRRESRGPRAASPRARRSRR